MNTSAVATPARWFHPILLLAMVHPLAAFGTFGYLIVNQGPMFNWWNWALLIPIDMFLAHIWPIHWLLVGLKTLVFG